MEKIFVTVGHPATPIPFVSKLAVFVAKGESKVKIAKKIRRHNVGHVAGIKFNPAELFWAIYDSMTAATPMDFSQNAPTVILDIMPEGFEQ